MNDEGETMKRTLLILLSFVLTIALLLFFVLTLAFAQDAKQLQEISQVKRLQASRIELAIMLSQLNNLLDASNPDTRKIVETVNRKLEIEGFTGLMRNLPPLEIDLKEHDVPLKEANETNK